MFHTNYDVYCHQEVVKYLFGGSSQELLKMGESEEVKVEISPQRELHVRVIKWKGKQTLDVRTYIKSENYTGYTKKGINIPLEKARELAQAIIKVAEKRGA